MKYILKNESVLHWEVPSSRGSWWFSTGAALTSSLSPRQWCTVTIYPHPVKSCTETLCVFVCTNMTTRVRLSQSVATCVVSYNPVYIQVYVGVSTVLYSQPVDHLLSDFQCCLLRLLLFFLALTCRKRRSRRELQIQIFSISIKMC